MKKLLLLLFSLILSTTIAFAYTHEETHVLILAGGKGKRMESTIPKVLHKLNGIALIDHVINLAKDIKSDSIAIVTSPDLQKDLLTRDITLIIQDEPMGTGHAVLSARLWFKDKNGDLFILFGDTPNIKPETLKKMQEQKKEYKAQIAVLGMRPTDPKRYGRIFLDDNGYLDRITEYKDASSEERKNNLCNSGVFLVELSYLDSLLKEIKNDNAAGEYYLTDIVKIGKEQGLKTIVVEAPEEELAGVNTQEELQQLQNKGN
jgi:bifunctional UDP-N-acetylglucosamine pyrophosphorylase/glucosamine-1-phosphate N-acetyltransferase